MIGDDQRDIASGISAGTKNLAAAWGYIQPEDDITKWKADAVIHQPSEINEWII